MRRLANNEKKFRLLRQIHLLSVCSFLSGCFATGQVLRIGQDYKTYTTDQITDARFKNDQFFLRLKDFSKGEFGVLFSRSGVRKIREGKTIHNSIYNEGYETIDDSSSLDRYRNFGQPIQIQVGDCLEFQKKFQSYYSEQCGKVFYDPSCDTVYLALPADEEKKDTCLVVRTSNHLGLVTYHETYSYPVIGLLILPALAIDIVTSPIQASVFGYLIYDLARDGKKKRERHRTDESK